jgi:hypothetical protein
MESKKAIWLKNPEVLRRFNHFKLDNGNNSDIAITQLLDLVDENKNEFIRTC